MASVRKTPGGKFELTIRHKLLPKRVYLTFDSELEATQYGEQCDRLLKAGVVPAGLVEDKPKRSETLTIILQAWINSGKPARTEIEMLQRLRSYIGHLRLQDLTYKWAEGWVRDMKLIDNLAPGTIRKRIGAVSRCIDDYLRQHPDVQVANPLRLLPRGSATYTAQEAERAVKLDLVAKRDQVRDRRLQPGEYGRIIKALAGEKRADRERPLDLKEADALRMLFVLIYQSGVRLREAYTLRAGQLQMRARVLRIQSSKQWHGRVVFREVPMRRELHGALEHYLGLREYAEGDLLFPWWDGTPDDLPRATAKLSGQFRRLFEYAQCPGLTEHDLRHEATCQWFEMRAPDGGWMFRTEEIEKIMGWAPGSSMAARYASFRAEDLAQRLWV
jgi:integrase